MELSYEEHGDYFKSFSVSFRFWIFGIDLQLICALAITSNWFFRLSRVKKSSFLKYPESQNVKGYTRAAENKCADGKARKKHQVQILNLCTLLDEKCCSYLLWVTMATVWWFFSTQNYIQVQESGLVSAYTICVLEIRITVNECGYQYGTLASLKIGSDLCLHVSVSL